MGADARKQRIHEWRIPREGEVNACSDTNLLLQQAEFSVCETLHVAEHKDRKAVVATRWRVQSTTTHRNVLVRLERSTGGNIKDAVYSKNRTPGLEVEHLPSWC